MSKNQRRLGSSSPGWTTPQKWSTFGFLMLEIWCCHYCTLNATVNDLLMVFGLCTTFSGWKVLAWASNGWQKLGWQLFDPSKFCVGTQVHSSKHDLTKSMSPEKGYSDDIETKTQKRTWQIPSYTFLLTLTLLIPPKSDSILIQIFFIQQKKTPYIHFYKGNNPKSH